jgi:lipopolysaccharide/colanic/teichoic acid biosynthesis glycosyltransferase
MLILFAPLILITAILIKIESRGPIIFSQERAGQYGKPFNIKKFRSMVADAEKSTGPVWAGEHDDRITKVGQVIRKLRVDELPQLWNVFRGEMSFVGPRPERPHFIRQLEKEIPYYSERLTVKPGITGWAQVCYPYGASVEDAVEKLNYDLFYIKNLTFFLDLLVIFRTVKIVLFGRGAR